MSTKIFVASSVEGLNAAYAVQENLDHDFEVTVWPQGVFNLNKFVLENLLAIADSVDAAVFIFTPDDVVDVRGEKENKVRDNVLFELGLFMGRLKRDFCFVLQPRGTKELSLPTDLAGIVTGTYKSDREDGNMVAALGPACNQIRRILNPLSSKKKHPSQTEELPNLLLDFPYRLFFSPVTGNSKRIVFKEGGLIVEGNNKNEHKWRIKDDKLELINLNGEVFSRFVYDDSTKVFRHTNDSDTLSLRDQYIAPDK